MDSKTLLPHGDLLATHRTDKIFIRFCVFINSHERRGADRPNCLKLAVYSRPATRFGAPLEKILRLDQGATSALTG